MGFDCPWLLGKTCVGCFRVSVVDISHESIKVILKVGCPYLFSLYSNFLHKSVFINGYGAACKMTVRRSDS